MGRIKAANGAFSEIDNKDVWALDAAEWTAEQAGYEPLESCYARFVALLQDFMRHNRVRSVVEFGCGFWSCARAVPSCATSRSEPRQGLGAAGANTKCLRRKKFQKNTSAIAPTLAA
jgi:hypothetical protein